MNNSLALRTQAEARQASKDGDPVLALSCYKKLLPMVQYLEDLRLTGLPAGMSLQLCKRAIELEEVAITELPYLGE